MKTTRIGKTNRVPTGRFDDLAGKRFGALVVVDYAGLSNTMRRRSLWRCRCDCGAEHITTGRTLVAEQCKSCRACLKNRLGASSRRHGCHDTREYRCWANAIQRCTNQKSKDWHLYGGRGIAVCERWLKSFEAFLSDMGPIPECKRSLDRFPDKNGDYRPGNCRWADDLEQSRNSRRNINITHNSKTQCLSAWAVELGIKRATIDGRLHRGKAFAEAIGVAHA